MIRSVTTTLLLFLLLQIQVNGILGKKNSRESAITASYETFPVITSTKEFIETILEKNKKEMGPRDYEAVNDCVMFMDSTAQEMNDTIRELKFLGSRMLSPEEFEFHLGGAQSSVSAALTDQDTCLQGFEDLGIANGTIEVSIAAKVNITEEAIIKALDLVAQYADNYSNSTKFITSSCSSTFSPKICRESLLPYATNSLVQSPIQLAKSALTASLTTAKSTRSFLQNLTKLKGMSNNNEYEAVKICLGLVNNGVNELTRAVQEIEYLREKHFENWDRKRDFWCRLSDLLTRISSARVDGSKCWSELNKISGFNSTRVEFSIRRRITNSRQVTRNALVLVNLLALKN